MLQKKVIHEVLHLQKNSLLFWKKECEKKVNFCIIVKNKDLNIEANKTKNRERYEERDVKLLTDGEN